MKQEVLDNAESMNSPNEDRCSVLQDQIAHLEWINDAIEEAMDYIESYE